MRFISILANINYMPWRIIYYNERVKSAIDILPTGVRADFARLLQLLEEFGADLRLPHSRAMGGGLFELRPRGREGIARVFYCMQMGQTIVILHSFIKKTPETPKHELDIATRRMKEVNHEQR